MQRHVVVGVEAGGDDDVDVGGRGDPRDAGDVTAEPDDRQVDDAVHAAGLELVEAVDRVGLSLVLVAPDVGMVVDDLGGQHEDVFMHQRHAEVGGVDGSSRGIQLRHSADATDAAGATLSPTVTWLWDSGSGHRAGDEDMAFETERIRPGPIAIYELAV